MKLSVYCISLIKLTKFARMPLQLDPIPILLVACISLQLESIPIPFPCLNISRSHRPSPLLLQPLRQRTNVLI